MLTFEFNFLGSSEIDSYSLGDLTIRCENGELSSNSSSFMVFFSLTILLDSLRKLLTDEFISEYEFVGIDSGFQIYFCKQNGLISIENHDRMSIGLFSCDDLIHSVWNGVCSFLSQPGHLPSEEEIAFDDLISSLNDFAEEFSLPMINFA